MDIPCFRQCSYTRETYRQVQQVNQKVLKLVDELIDFKENILKNVLCCEMFTMNYPLLIEHIIREAKLYREYVCSLEKEGTLTNESMREVELFEAADGFAKDYSALLKQCHCAQERILPMDSLEETLKFRDFKEAGTKGIEQCKIRSVILPLLADHVLREANHYIRLLKS